MMRIVVGISGSSSPIYGIRVLESLAGAGVETHVIISAGAQRTIALETRWTIEAIKTLAHGFYDSQDMAAAVSSGSFRTDGMIIAPCSMKTLAAVAHSLSSDLLARAADVTLKEGRRLVLVPRETPLHLGHLRNLVRVAEIGAVVLPPMPAFYHAPETVDDLINQTVGKILDQFNIPHALFRRWEGDSRAGAAVAQKMPGGSTSPSGRASSAIPERLLEGLREGLPALLLTMGPDRAPHAAFTWTAAPGPSRLRVVADWPSTSLSHIEANPRMAVQIVGPDDLLYLVKGEGKILGCHTVPPDLRLALIEMVVTQARDQSWSKVTVAPLRYAWRSSETAAPERAVFRLLKDGEQ